MVLNLFRYLSVILTAALLNFALFLAAPSAKSLSSAEVLTEQMRAPWKGDLAEMRKRKFIRVLVPYSRIILFMDKNQFRGTAVEALRAFDKQLNKGRSELESTALAIIPTSRKDLIKDLVEGRGDIAIGNLTITKSRQEMVDFSDPITRDVSELVVTTIDHAPVESIEDLSGMEIYVRPSSSYYASLQKVNETLKSKNLAPIKIVDGDEHLEDGHILEMINAGMIKATIVDSHKLVLWKQVYDKIKIQTVAVHEDGQIGWAIRKNTQELAGEINKFVKTAKRGTEFGNIMFKRYLKSTKHLQSTSPERLKEQFASLRTLFQKYGKEFNIDWRLIASQSYQESRFDNSLKSKAGAVGLMQIKPSTAADKNVGIKNITSPDANVNAGVKYLRFLADKYFDDPDLDQFNRILFSLAAYNAGPNRLARLRKKSANPNEWFGAVEWEVSKAVGAEPVRYVRNIFMYYILFQKSLAE
ncbi:MAG: transporter substrate-binding domain-containing protein [Rhizobiaceae bacterium]|nr:transporter substrate-binding domain-containing protein [Rhizobiaceae bacterium]